MVKPHTTENLIRTIKEHLQKQQEAKEYSEEKVKEYIETRAREYEAKMSTRRLKKWLGEYSSSRGQENKTFNHI